ncbi:DUF3800 domain-containing protein [Metabacillus niabensis]|uniref:DUF3800 domain-containing protein n=1 Tax=Metabacillus niabensis TaxID=324854 RepID=UPI0039A2DF30
MFTPPLQTQYMNIFFDESGQGSGNDKPSTMGGLLIPDIVYTSPELVELTNALRTGEIKLHWTDYTGDSKQRKNIENAIKVFSKYARYSKMNVINYNRSTLDSRYKLSEDQGSQSKKELSKREKSKLINYATLMIYTKIPERIFYGLLRHYGKDVYIKTNIFIEKEGKYEKYNLEQRLMENLNTQSLYRAEQFWVEKCEMVSKGVEIGVELVDLLLGIIRLIINNKKIPFGLSLEEYSKKKLKGSYMKTSLVIDLLKNNEFNNFLRNIKYFEWDSQKELNLVAFRDYLDLFMATNFEHFNPSLFNEEGKKLNQNRKNLRKRARIWR